MTSKRQQQALHELHEMIGLSVSLSLSTLK
jgi:hypothetical protein